VAHRRMTYILLGALVGLMLLFYGILWLRIRQGPDRETARAIASWLSLESTMSFQNVVPYGLGLERFFATLVCVIFAGTMMGNEYDWRTVGLVVGRGVRRWHFIFAKLVISLLFVAVAVLIGFVAALIASVWFSHLYGLPYGTIDAKRLLHMVYGLARLAFVISPSVLLALLFAVTWRSAGQAVGAALGIYFTEGIFTNLLTNARGWLSHIPEGLVNFNGDAVMRANGRVGNAGDSGAFIFGSGDAPLLRATLVICIWVVVALALFFWQFQRRDVQE
ncbi:MAG: ABC transporter permease subunit, partial [Tepidiformaceae bacterium]